MVRSISRVSLPKARSIVSDLGRQSSEQSSEGSVHVTLVAKTRLERDACAGLAGLAQQERCMLEAKACRSLHQPVAGCTPIAQSTKMHHGTRSCMAITRICSCP